MNQSSSSDLPEVMKRHAEDASRSHKRHPDDFSNTASSTWGRVPIEIPKHAHFSNFTSVESHNSASNEVWLTSEDIRELGLKEPSGTVYLDEVGGDTIGDSMAIFSKK